MKKRPFTLFEVLISFGLLAFMMSTLFFWHHHVLLEKKMIKKMKVPIQEEKYAHQYLTRLFKSVSLKATQKNEIPLFFTQDHALVLTFDNGSTEEPLLSAHVLGKLFYNPKTHNLSIKIWPTPKLGLPLQKIPSYSFVLMDNVEELEFEFFFPKDPLQPLVAPEEVGKIVPRTGWQKEWRSEYSVLPLLVKISWKRMIANRLQKFEFIFDIPKTIVYVKDIGDL